MGTMVCVLGQTRIETGQETVDLRGALKRSLLSRLALTPDRTVSADALINAMWGDHPPRTAKQSLHVHINHLRHALRPHGLDSIIETVAGGYRIGVDPDQIDAGQFEGRCRRGSEALRRGNLRAARDHLGDAVAAWGEPLIDLLDDPGALGERHRLTALYEHATDDLADARLQLGEFESAISLLRATMATRPLRDGPYRLLYRAYSMAGRRAEADALRAEAASMYAEEFGSEPPEGLFDPPTRDGSPAAMGEAAARIWNAAVKARGAIAVCLPHDLRLEPTFDDLRSLSEQSHRPALLTRTDRHDAVPLGRLVRHLPMPPTRADATSSLSRKRHLYQSMATALEDSVDRNALVVVDQVQHANEMTVGFLAFLLTGNAPPAATFVLCFRTDLPGVGGNLERLGPLCSEVVELEGAGPLAQQRPPDLTETQRTLDRLIRLCETATPSEVIARASGLRMAAASEAVDQLVKHGLVTIDPAGRIEATGRIAPPGLLPEDDDPRPLHLALADAVAEVTDVGDTSRVLAEAQHRLAALPLADPEQAWGCARDAATYLDGIDAHSDLVRLLEPCTLLDAPPLDLVVQLGRSQVRSGHPDGPDTLSRAIEAAQRIGDAALLARSVRSLNETRAPQLMTGQRRQLTEQTLEALADDPAQIDTRVQLLTDLANGFHLDDPVQAEHLGRDALELARDDGNDATTARALTGLIQAVWRPDSVEERLELSIEAHERARRADSVETHVLALTYEAAALVEQGNLRRAEPPLLYAASLAAEVQVPRFQWWAAAWQALVRFALGDLDDADAAFSSTLATWHSHERTDAIECYGAQIVTHRMLTGRADEIADAAAGLARETGLPMHQAVAAATLAMADRPREARGFVDDLRVGSSPLRRGGAYGATLAMLAEAAWLCGEKTMAGPLAEAIEPIASNHAVVNVWGGGGFYWGSLRHGLGLMRALAGDVDGGARDVRLAALEHTNAGAAAFARRSQSVLEEL